MASYEPNATAASLLGFLHEGPMSGWDLVNTAQDRIGGFWSLTRSQVYRELSALEQAGYVSAGDRGSRDRRPFTITEAGHRAFVSWLAKDPGEEVIRFPLLLKLGFGAFIDPAKLQSYLAIHKHQHQKNLEHYKEQKKTLAENPDADRFAHAVTDFGIAYETMILAWFDELPAKLRDT